MGSLLNLLGWFIVLGFVASAVIAVVLIAVGMVKADRHRRRRRRADRGLQPCHRCSNMATIMSTGGRPYFFCDDHRQWALGNYVSMRRPNPNP